MGTKSKFSLGGLGFLLCSFVALVLLLCFLNMQEYSDCVTGHGCYYGEMKKKNRKFLYGGVHEKGQNIMGGGSELRVVPSGPDPLHHNGNPKNKKPRSP